MPLLNKLLSCFGVENATSEKGVGSRPEACFTDSPCEQAALVSSGKTTQSTPHRCSSEGQSSGCRNEVDRFISVSCESSMRELTPAATGGCEPKPWPISLKAAIPSLSNTVEVKAMGMDTSNEEGWSGITGVSNSYLLSLEQLSPLPDPHRRHNFPKHRVSYCSIASQQSTGTQSRPSINRAASLAQVLGVSGFKVAHEILTSDAASLSQADFVNAASG